MILGRPTKYDESILEKAQEYIDSCEDSGREVNLPTLEGLAYHLKVHKDTIQEWRKVHEDFSVLMGDLLAKQAKRLVNSGLSGRYNPTIAKVLLTKHGYREGVETDITTKGDKIQNSLSAEAIAMAEEQIKHKLSNE